MLLFLAFLLGFLDKMKGKASYGCAASTKRVSLPWATDVKGWVSIVGVVHAREGATPVQAGIFADSHSCLD